MIKTANSSREWRRAAKVWEKVPGFDDKVQWCLEMARACKQIEDAFKDVYADIGK